MCVLWSHSGRVPAVLRAVGSGIRRDPDRDESLGGKTNPTAVQCNLKCITRMELFPDGKMPLRHALDTPAAFSIAGAAGQTVTSDNTIYPTCGQNLRDAPVSFLQ